MPQTVLVIDDDPAVAHMLRLMGPTQGFTVDIARSGIEGLELAQCTDPDLIVLDVNLPGMSGFELCERLRAGGTQTPILMVTANRDEDVVRGLELGADAYLTKPFSIRELLARMGALLRRQRLSTTQLRPGRIRFCGLIIDVQRHEAVRDGDTIELSAIEVNLLSHLVSRRGFVVTREELIEQVWGGLGDIDARSVDTHMHRLRRKIEKHGQPPTYLHSVPGAGYRLDYRPPGTGHAARSWRTMHLRPGSRARLTSPPSPCRADAPHG